jgi:hypothetical protein
MTWLTAMEYLCHKINTSRSFPHSWLITRFVTRWTRRVSLVEQELLTLLEHECSPMVFIGVRITRFLVLYVYFVDRFLSFVLFLLAIVFSVLLRSQWVSSLIFITTFRRVWRYQRDNQNHILVSKKNRKHNGQKKKYKGQKTIYKIYI